MTIFLVVYGAISMLACVLTEEAVCIPGLF